MGHSSRHRCPAIAPYGLVIGYGNPVRGDDYAGQAAAERIRQWRVAGLQVVTKTQLTPELAPLIARSRRVIFLDAAIDRTHVEVRCIEPVRQLTSSHQSDPAALLALARLLYGHAPRAMLVTIPAYDTSLSLTLSPATERAVAYAARLARAYLIRRYWPLRTQAVGAS
ncbi:hydrogenase maturation protease [Chloroflexus aggregans]|uniref:Hydrogenase maturation protease n=1 Tax=Chloroflexus aggregans (strain MD-66 / DSM 9485) TaxID=326427 RepID=B8G3U5_CHLAD|nr:hydrogenase maturation protease [Chloroflexus aggregans]ACL25347.1 hydrogenase maturation protease [Chloroflexus aggregans DSM 9485]